MFDQQVADTDLFPWNHSVPALRPSRLIVIGVR
jgi:hypothetical protein